tara:strand:+ start:1219 stop:1911 length:693 start_codon:yes stop_codon:yes gene_type:complete
MKKELTIIAVSDIKIKGTINSLIKSSLSLKPYKTILFSSKKIKLSNKQADIIDLIKVDRINSIEKYSSFIIYKLFNYIQTSHILIVQWDGYVINPKKWDSEFLKYDFIGAPFIPRDNDAKYCRDKNGAFYSVGNGGFSIRSRRLLEAPSKFKLLDNKEYTNFHEDGFFSVYHRSFLESKGFVWAPFVIANKFSIESLLSIKDLKDLPLGFHGKKIFYLLLFLKIINYLKF